MTSAIPWAARFSEPAQMTSSDLRERSARPCSPSAQRSASARLLLPDPFGPTTALIPGPNSTFVRSANDLKPWNRRASRRGSAGARRLGHVMPSSAPAPGPFMRAQLVERLGCGGRLGDPSRWTLADAEQVAADPDLDPERLLVVRPAGIDDVVGRPLAGRPLGEFLEAALGALEGADRCLRRQLGVGQRDQPVADRAEPEVEIEGAGDGLEGRRQEQGPPTPAALGFTLAEHQVGPELDPAGQSGQPGRRHDRRPAGTEIALVVARMPSVERVGDREVDHGVTEELETFVVAEGDVRMLVLPARMDECLLEESEVPDREPDPQRERLGGTHGPGGPIRCRGSG